MTVKVIGAGLAGVEAAFTLAGRGVKVELYDIKPKSFTPAHSNKNFGELVCSNSLKSNDIFGNACGLLKEEMRILGSLTREVAEKLLQTSPCPRAARSPSTENALPDI